MTSLLRTAKAIGQHYMKNMGKALPNQTGSTGNIKRIPKTPKANYRTGKPMRGEVR
ncbi:MAG: hypothetical protein AAB815_00755 [Patescibacteria group bacterium]